MIGKLKLKFILLSMTALLVLLTVIVAGMNIINYTSVIDEADTVLSVISQNRGMFPDFELNAGSRPNTAGVISRNALRIKILFSIL